jgi:hypothetical protein
MADNVTIPAQGTGTTTPVIAADDVSSVFFQKIKIDAGGDGVSVPIIAGQQAMAASVPVVIASNQTSVPVALAAGTNNVGDVDILSIAAGDNNIGNVDIVTLPSLPAGTNNIGDVDVLTLPSLPAGSNAIGKLAANSGVDIGDVDVTSISAGENHIGEFGAAGTLLEVTLSLDTSAYADGDVMADTQSLSNAVRVNAGRAILQSVTVIDEDDVGQTFDIIFLDTNNALGTENSAPNISDANARTILGRVRIESSEYIDLGGVKIANKNGVGMFLKAASATTTLYAGTIIRGAGTYTASGVKLRLGLLWD